MAACVSTPALVLPVEGRASDVDVPEEETGAVVAVTGAASIASPVEPRTPVFREMLDDVHGAIPTLDELNRFGLFDLSTSARLLAEYRRLNPAPSPTSAVPPSPSPSSDAETTPSPRRPSEPQHRHSVAIYPLSNQSTAEPLASPSSLAPRLNPFNLVRKSTVRPKASPRAKSTGDVPLAPVTSTSANPAPFDFVAGVAAAALSRNETVKENRAPRKLRKNAPPKITLRTDDEYLLRPFNDATNPSVEDAAPGLSVSLPASSPRPVQPARRHSWRSSTSSFVSSPLAYEHPDVSPSRQDSPSPLSAFPAGIRRETLPPVERKKRNSTVSSSESLYLADNERVARLSPKAVRNRFSLSAGPSSPIPPSPTGSASGSVWTRALKLGKGRLGSGSRPSSMISMDSPLTPGFEEAEARGFEVIGRPVSRPAVERSVSEDVVPGRAPLVSPGLSEAEHLPTSASHPNLSRITEQPETPDKRRSLGSTDSAGSRRLVNAASIESLPPSSGVTTPAMLSASSSMTARDAAEGLSRRPPLSRSRRSSNLALASSHKSSTSLHELYVATQTPPVSATHLPLSSSASLVDSWRVRSSSSRSSSRSHDSYFLSGDDTPASSADLDDECTGATSSAQDDDEHDRAQYCAHRDADDVLDMLPGAFGDPSMAYGRF
ncbi:hypothetical protein Rhopal_005511-T1 [Rhodotorula paludigena]|uniref:Proteophosphoglycan ppg4 n=1 Tax=Rhodotorula paludigena TaxID=86838 RepID=A0AAV5GJ41_9BASI|nr:hypothetical protein Rhopal_005511-T1 [Rhodotorula paludigena]